MIMYCSSFSAAVHFPGLLIAGATAADGMTPEGPLSTDSVEKLGSQVVALI